MVLLMTLVNRKSAFLCASMCVSIILALLISHYASANQLSSDNPSKLTVELQLFHLAKCGIRPNANSKIQDLFVWHSKETMIKQPYRLLIDTLALDIQREPFLPMSNKLWMCDYEAIEGRGDYVAILNRLESMTNQALRLSSIEDFIDIKKKKAWLKFQLKGKTIHWDLTVDDDWLDPKIFILYDRLLRQSDSKLRIYSNPVDYGQSAFFAAFTLEQFDCFQNLAPSGLKRIANQ